MFGNLIFMSCSFGEYVHCKAECGRLESTIRFALGQIGRCQMQHIDETLYLIRCQSDTDSNKVFNRFFGRTLSIFLGM